MNEKLRTISKLAHKYPLVIPPGPFEDYPHSGITYLIERDDANEIIADNPYVIEYLLYNNKEEWIKDVSHMLYLGHLAMNSTVSNSSVYVLFNESIMHLLDFKIERKELPVFKIFLDHLAHSRQLSNTSASKNAFFPWKLSTFLKYGEYVSHELSSDEISALHQRLCSFQQSLFPREALTNLFNR